MSGRSWFPLPPERAVVRYDLSLVEGLTEAVAPATGFPARLRR